MTRVTSVIFRIFGCLLLALSSLEIHKYRKRIQGEFKSFQGTTKSRLFFRFSIGFMSTLKVWQFLFWQSQILISKISSWPGKCNKFESSEEPENRYNPSHESNDTLAWTIVKQRMKQNIQCCSWIFSRSLVAFPVPSPRDG